jgi:hypothetical protein
MWGHSMLERKQANAMTIATVVPMIALTVAFWASVVAGIIWVAYRL